MNILETGQRSLKLTANAKDLHVKFKDSHQVQELVTVLIKYLNNHVNHGVFTGVVGANLEVVMKLDLSVQLSNILLLGTLSTGDGKESAFEAFVKDTTHITDQQKEQVFSEMIKWIIINYVPSKSKSSPAGQKIF
jgi:hypothetical protein